VTFSSYLALHGEESFFQLALLQEIFHRYMYLEMNLARVWSNDERWRKFTPQTNNKISIYDNIPVIIGCIIDHYNALTLTKKKLAIQLSVLRLYLEN